MTPGERMIWAAAFVESYNRRMGQAVRLDAYGTPQRSERAAAFVPMQAITDAASLVRIAREVLPKMAAAEVKPGREQQISDALAMLREMLGVDPSGSPYR